jgi:hypothetical protein
MELKELTLVINDMQSIGKGIHMHVTTNVAKYAMLNVASKMFNNQMLYKPSCIYWLNYFVDISPMFQTCLIFLACEKLPSR